jgi:phosphoribosylformylglycinamidine synthase subunit PurL
MADACRAVGCPGRPGEPLSIVSGNVSFYNLSAAGRAIPPSPIVACFGLLDDYARAVTRRMHQAGDVILLTGRRGRAWGRPGQGPGGRVPVVDLAAQAREIRAVLALAETGRLRAAHDVADGGLLRAAWEMLADEDRPGPLGLELDLEEVPAEPGLPPHELLLSETPGFVLEVESNEAAGILSQLRAAGVVAAAVGRVLERPRFVLRHQGAVWADPDPSALHQAWRTRLESITHTGSPDGSGGEE